MPVPPAGFHCWARGGVEPHGAVGCRAQFEWSANDANNFMRDDDTGFRCVCIQSSDLT